MRSPFLCAGLIGLLAMVGCAHDKAVVAPRSPASSAAGALSTNASPAGEKLIVTPDKGLHGTVAWVNSNLRFVVLNFPVGRLPALGQHLNLYRRGLKVGEVKVSGPQRDDNIVADIITGDAETGDTVRDR